MGKSRFPPEDYDPNPKGRPRLKPQAIEREILRIHQGDVVPDLSTFIALTRPMRLVDVVHGEFWAKPSEVMRDDARVKRHPARRNRNLKRPGQGEKVRAAHAKKCEAERAAILHRRHATIQAKGGYAEQIRKGRQTLQARYGVGSPIQAPGAAQRYRETLRTRYGDGVDNPSQIPEVQCQKQQTYLSRYGTEHWFQSTQFKEISRASSLQRFGTLHPTQSERVKQKIRSTSIARGHYNVLPNGLTVQDYAVQRSVPYVYACEVFRKHGPEFCLKYMDRYEGPESSLEVLAEQVLQGLIQPFRKDSPVGTPGGKFYRPDFVSIDGKLYVEADGLFNHSDGRQPDRQYHREKARRFAEQGLGLLQFYEDEFRLKPQIIRSMVEARLGRSPIKVGARDCTIEQVNTEEANRFMLENHLMGPSRFDAAVGLRWQGEWVSVLRYRKKSQSGIEAIDISRFASHIGYSVPGGLSRLLGWIDKTLHPQQLHSWVDLRYGTGQSLRGLGFEQVRVTQGWRWTDGYETFHRLKCRANMDARGLSQAQHAKLLRWYPIYDAGQALWVRR